MVYPVRKKYIYILDGFSCFSLLVSFYCYFISRILQLVNCASKKKDKNNTANKV